MLDLSNNNAEPNWKRIYQAGQRRVYLKASQGTTFVDQKQRRWKLAARQAGFKVGLYHFASVSHEDRVDPIREARFFCTQIGRLRKGDLRPCLDFEFGDPDPEWAERFIAEVTNRTGVKPIIYSYPDYLRRANFKKAPAPLWLASYGRNDGKEHPFLIPAPWKRIVAHQYSSQAKVAGVPGLVDISHVFNYRALDVPEAL